jgi:hypothetical protein
VGLEEGRGGRGEEKSRGVPPQHFMRGGRDMQKHHFTHYSFLSFLLPLFLLVHGLHKALSMFCRTKIIMTQTFSHSLNHPLFFSTQHTYDTDGELAITADGNTPEKSFYAMIDKRCPGSAVYRSMACVKS